MKKILIINILLLLLLSACNKKEETITPSQSEGCDILDDCTEVIETGENMTFKEKYESINGLETSSGAIHRTISIDEDHPFVEVKADEIVRKIENKETFYLYVGDELCPWCRSVIEKAIEVSKLAHIDTIYYVQIWNDEGDEILRDQYIIENNELVKTVEGKQSYYKLLEYFDEVLREYTITDENNNVVDVNEKRIYAPNFFYVENGEVKRFTTGRSDKQLESRQELSEEILIDEEIAFKDFFGLN